MASSQSIISPPHSRRLVFFSILFLGSGAAGLIYQIVWERLLELHFGVTMTAITLIVAAYMAGLGLGSLFGGRVAEKSTTALFLYGLLEVGIGIFGFFSPYLISKIGQATAGSPYWLVFILSFLLLLIPTFLMGMTLPLLSQAFISRVETSGQIIGILYGINTIGAAIGTLAAGYVLIGAFGFNGTILFAFALNSIIGIFAILASRQEIRKIQKAGETSSSLQGSTLNIGYLRILFASFLVGFIGLGFEMLWIRTLSIINKNTAYGFPSILFVFLGGLAIGGYVWGRQADRSANIERLFWGLEIGVGLVASLTFFFFWYSLNTDWGSQLLGDFWQMQKPIPPVADIDNSLVFSRRIMLSSLWNYFLPILILVLPSSFLMGGGLPILDRIAINSPEVAGRRIGDIHLANIIGSVVGSLTISFLLLPTIGSEITHKVLVMLSFVFPALFLIKGTGSQTQKVKLIFPILLIGASALLLLFLPGKGQFYTRLFEMGTGKPAITRESSDTVLALTLDDTTNEPDWLWISGETNSFYPTDGTYESRALLCAGTSHPKRILVIGMGGGITAYFLQSIPDLEELVIVELMEDLGDLLYENIGFVRLTLDNPLVEYVIDDGRRYLNANPDERFDLIYADPLRRYSAGHNNLYSQEAMQLYQSHLTENGVFCAYVDQPNVIPKTIASIFPEVDQFRSRTVVASNKPLEYDFAYMENLATNYVTTSSEFINQETINAIQPQNLLTQFARSHEQILSDEKDIPPLTDNNPWLEYYFFNVPQRIPVWPKGDSNQKFFERISNCTSNCQTEMLLQSE